MTSKVTVEWQKNTLITYKVQQKQILAHKKTKQKNLNRKMDVIFENYEKYLDSDY